MLGTVAEGCGDLDQCRKGWLQLHGESVVSVAVLDVVEDVVQNVEDMQTPTPSRRHTAPVRPQCRGVSSFLVGKRLGECDQVLAKRGRPSRRRNQVVESPLLASLARGLADGSTQRSKSDTDEACYQTWTLGGEHSAMVELTRASIDSMSSREHGRGSARNRAPESAVLATISSADAIAGDTTSGGGMARSAFDLGCSRVWQCREGRFPICKAEMVSALKVPRRQLHPCLQPSLSGILENHRPMANSLVT